jgi:ABC-type transport system substrate-binding protein
MAMIRKHTTKSIGILGLLLSIVAMLVGSALAQTSGGALTGTLATTGIRGLETWQDTKGTDNHAYNLIYDKLVWYDETYNFQPGLFESWSSPDAMTWTFNVRPGVTWHDGVPFTAQHVIDFFDTLGDPASGASTEKSVVVEGVSYRAVDDMTVEMVLPEPNAVLLDQLDLFYISRASDFDAENPVGTGPFKLAEWNVNQSMVFTRNEDYWQEGRPYLDEVTLLMVPDATTRLNLLLTGEVDVATAVAIGEIERVQAQDGLEVVTTPGEFATIHHYMLYKTSEPPFDNKLVRQAINYAIDREVMLDINFGYGSVKSNAIGQGSIYFNPDAISYNVRNVERAKELMAEAGYTPGQEAFEVSLFYWREWPENIQIVQIVQANLAEIGIKVNLELLEIGTWVDSVINKHEYEMALTALIPGWDPDSQLSNVYITDDGSALEWENADFMAAWAAGRATADIDERIAAYATAQEIAMDEAPAVVLNTVPRFDAYSSRVQNMIRPDSGNFNYHYVWVNP